MNISRILKFLVAGIVIGAILFFAGFGMLNLMEESTDKLVATEKSAPEVVPVAPPKIEITANQPSAANEQATEGGTQEQGTSSSPIKIKPLGSESTSSTEPSQELQKIAFGTLTLSTVNSVNGAPTNADFLIQNSQSIAIALVKDTSSSTLSLPVGDYKITVSQGAEKVVRFLGVKDGQNGSETFELNVPVLTGEATDPVIVGADTAAPAADTSNDEQPETPTVSQTATSAEAKKDEPSVTATGGLRVSALTKQGKRPTAVNFFIRDSKGNSIKDFKNVKTQQIILPAGTYKITAETADTTVVKEVEVLATKGIHEIFMISGPANSTQQNTNQTTAQRQQNTAQTAAPTTAPSKTATESNKEPGKLELFAQKASNNSALRSNFYVQKPNGSMVASKVYVESIGYKLPAGKYKIIVRATGYKNKSTMLNVRAGQTRREVFKLDAVNPAGANQSSAPATTAPTASPAGSTTQPTPSAQAAAPVFGGLTVNIVNASDGSALLADIVVTQRDGTPLKQANGVASASFDLPPREFLVRVTHAGLTTSHQVNVVPGKLAIKTISFDTDRMSRQERRRQRRQQRRERLQ